MQSLALPNILYNPDVRLSYTLNNQSYMFRYKWCDSFCLLDIYIIRDSKSVYLIKGSPIIPNSNLIARVKDNSLISGSLICINKYGSKTKLSSENFHSDFELVFIPKDELND